MRKTAEKTDIKDMPQITLNEGRFILGLGRRTWRRQWDEVFQHKVAHWKTSRCVMLNLESLVAAVYPAAVEDDALRTRIAHDFMWELIQERKRTHRVKHKDGEVT